MRKFARDCPRCLDAMCRPHSCTEGGTVACECTEHHFHVNDDWIILESVDENNHC